MHQWSKNTAWPGRQNPLAVQSSGRHVNFQRGWKLTDQRSNAHALANANKTPPASRESIKSCSRSFRSRLFPPNVKTAKMLLLFSVQGQLNLLKHTSMSKARKYNHRIGSATHSRLHDAPADLSSLFQRVREAASATWNVSFECYNTRKRATPSFSQPSTPTRVAPPRGTVLNTLVESPKTSECTKRGETNTLCTMGGSVAQLSLQNRLHQ